ncbi:MAG TPA: polysaccharide biosynthesis/export family protein [Verrucomicrobiae bacterium]|nr:polysaccharide biosynthesis/export family protein [Verrucomicrobiae bacterium]
MRRDALLLVISSVSVSLITGCQQPRPISKSFNSLQPEAVTLSQVSFTNQIDPSWLQVPSHPFTLGPGDKLEIVVIGEPTSRVTTVVGPDGKIYFNLLPGIDVWGLTLDQARAQIESGLARYLKERPQVSLVLRDVESKQVWVLGRVQAPGLYPLTTPMTLLEALSRAGGTISLSAFRQEEAAGASDELADLRRSFVLREGRRLPVDFARLLQQGDLSQNIYLQAGDFVYLPTATTKEVYVLGAVTQPRAVPYREGLTAAGAVASAYGTLTGAYMHHVTVVRGSLLHPEVAVIDYKNVIRGTAPDLALKPGDIVYVPFSPYRYLYRYAQLAIDTFVSSVAINAGTSTVGVPNVGQAGVFIPVGSGVQILTPISPPPVH